MYINIIMMFKQRVKNIYIIKLLNVRENKLFNGVFEMFLMIIVVNFFKKGFE